MINLGKEGIIKDAIFLPLWAEPLHIAVLLKPHYANIFGGVYMLSVFAEPVANGAAQAGEAAQAGPMSLIASFLPMILLIVVFYFLLIRPQRKRDKENREMLANLKVGDEIITIGGIVGTITKIKDEKIVIETGTKTEKQLMTLERWAVRSVEKKLSAD